MINVYNASLGRIVVYLALAPCLLAQMSPYVSQNRPSKTALDNFLIGKYSSVGSSLLCARLCKRTAGCLSYLYGQASPPDECYTTASHKQYTGRWNITETGIPCQAFAAQTPHAHVNIYDYQYPDGTVAAAGNNCRDPDNEGFLWCYTLDPAKRWEFCGIDRCTDDNCFIYSTFQAATVDLGVYEYYQALP